MFGTVKMFLVGALFIIGGLSGKFVLLGTNSGLALVAVGVVFLIMAGLRLIPRSE
jgi:hypothetical protein